MAEDERTEETPELPEGLLARLRADPTRAPEYVALAAAERHGPAAARWRAEQREERPDRLARQVRRRHVRWARFEGGAMGLGGFVTVVPDLAALAWIQSRMVFFLAAAHGYDPTDRMRPAELLVLQELYEDPAAARDALDGAGRRIASAYVDQRVRGSGDEELGRRLLKMVARRGAQRLAGRLIPGVGALFNARDNARDTRELAERAVEFYGG